MTQVHTNYKKQSTGEEDRQEGTLKDKTQEVCDYNYYNCCKSHALDPVSPSSFSYLVGAESVRAGQLGPEQAQAVKAGPVAAC